MPGSSQDSNEDESIVFTNGLELRPQLLYTKFQRLKNTTKLARVVVINEHPCPKLPMQETTRGTTMKTDMKTGSPRESAVDESKQTLPDLLSLTETGMNGKQSFGSLHNNRQQQPKALLYYPEECHVASITECKEWNGRLMRHMIALKAAKNQTFQQKQEEDRAINVRRQMITPNAAGQPKRQNVNRETQEIRLSTQMLLGVGDDNGLLSPMKAVKQNTQGSA